MNNRKITSGLIFLFVGIVLLLDVLDIVEFNWVEIIKYWPLLIILGGINMLMPNSEFGHIAKLGFTCILLGFLAYVGFVTPKQDLLSRFLRGSNIHISTNDDDSIADSNYSHSLSVPLPDTLTYASANFDMGTTNLHLSDVASTVLFEAKNTSNSYFMELSSNTSKQGIPHVNLNGEKKNEGKSKNNKTLIKLNKEVVWDLNFDIGASEVNFDLSPFKVRHINFDTGVSSVKLKLGMPVSHSQVNIDAGASSLEILVPKNAACRIVSDGGLSTISMDAGFLNKTDGIRETANYPNAAEKFDFAIDGGVTSIKIKQY
ncbi:LiaF transmembrane domain-containing protein [Sphingobacterium sp. SYP-B4668]|uniref:LiaF transmembrane domain-containing protein n=1 Tax=Sphingobacterium sp. SYP-B4668 TaxID=2996035 RepID=UPI000532504E|nr:DUF5668 domain-containing protein [Sphingobacterium sp. SYP-B4668]